MPTTALRQPTGVRQPTAVNNSNLNIVNRPVTNHGIMGVKGLSGGPGFFLMQDVKLLIKVTF